MKIENNIGFLEALLPSITIGASVAFAITMIFFFITVIMTSIKLSKIKAQAALSFPKNEVLTEAMIYAEALRRNPELADIYKNLFIRCVLIYFGTFFIVSLLNYFGLLKTIV